MKESLGETFNEKILLNVKNVLQKRGFTREKEISIFTLVKIKVQFEKLS